MLTVDNNKIKIVQGDTGIINLKIDNYKFKDGDKAYFTVKEDYDSEAVITKVISIFPDPSTVVVELSKKDTDIEAKAYLYDIQLSLIDGRVDTVVLPNKFIVLGGVTSV